MDSLKNMNAAMRYIEDNLTHEIDFKEVAKINFLLRISFQKNVFFSSWHITIRIYSL